MGAIKNTTVGFKLSFVSIVLGIISLITFAVMATDGEGIAVCVYPLMIVGIVFTVLNMVLVNVEKTEKYFNRGSALACLMYGISLVMFFLGRMTWFMNIASKNNVTPLHTSFFVAAILFILTLIVSIVASFLKLKK